MLNKLTLEIVSLLNNNNSNSNNNNKYKSKLESKLETSILY